MIRYLLIFILTVFVLFSGCSTTKFECLKNEIVGNLGAPFNTQFDELFPVIYNQYLFVLSNRLSKVDYDLFNIELNNLNSNFEKELPFPKNSRTTQFSIYHNKSRNIQEIYFSGLNRSAKRIHTDIFYAHSSGKGWSEPKSISEINSEHFEAYPSISDDGRFLFFCSDRPNNYGEIDLFISERVNDKWTNPQNLGAEINTKYSEITPFIFGDKLFFSSNGYSEDGYDIMVADFSNGSVANIRKLPLPFNSQWDEKSPFLLDNQLYFTSNRPNGCGGYDVYAFKYCMDAVLEINLIASDKLKDNYGKITITSNNEVLLNSKELNNPIVRIKLKPENSYNLSFSHPCMLDSVIKYNLFVPCSDSSVLKFVYDIQIPDVYEEFTFEEYQVPFFVTGYYLPNVRKNLETLRLKFSYNLIGNTDSTRYIENPGPIYDAYTNTVEKALNDAKDFIIHKINMLKGDCIRGNSKLEIKLIGYADPRPISPLARYDGPQIDDDELEFSVYRGAIIDNNQLSKLRAYFTADYIRKAILNEFGDIFPKDKIQWKIEGRGIDDSPSLANEYKRRVSISISIK